MSRPIVTAAVVAATVVLIAALVYLFYPSATVPPGGRTITDADRGDEARETIAELAEDSADGRVNYDEAFTRAESYREEGRFADAQVLYFFAARSGHPPAAFQLGTMYDPLHHDPGTSLFPEPNAYQAFKYYTQALEGGLAEASTRLDALHEWAQREAQQGNFEAEQLLPQWN